MLPAICCSDEREPHRTGGAPTTPGLLCILTAGWRRRSVFADTADDSPCFLCSSLNQGRIDLIASLAKGPEKSRPLPHCSMSRVQRRGKVNRVNRTPTPKMEKCLFCSTMAPQPKASFSTAVTDMHLVSSPCMLHFLTFIVGQSAACCCYVGTPKLSGPVSKAESSCQL